MSILEAEQLVQTYGTQVLLDHVSFSIAKGERIGLIGVNGTGKSTLLKAIAEKNAPEEGMIRHAKAFRVAYLPQHPQFADGATALDCVYAGEAPIVKLLRSYTALLEQLQDGDAQAQQRLLSLQQRMDATHGWEVETAARTILNRLGITDLRTPAASLSGGEKKRVALAQVLIQPADLLLLDEPTNHLDNETISWLEKLLGDYPGALMMITHDRYFLNRVTKTIYELDRGRLHIYEGNYATYLEQKAERERLAAGADAKRRNLLRRELEWLHRGAKARSTKQKARLQRVEALQNEQSVAQKQSMDIALGAQRLGNKVVEIEDLSLAAASRTLIDRLNLLVLPGERIGIVGANGSGKTTLLNVIAGSERPQKGKVTIGETVRFGYYRQEQPNVDTQLRVIDFIKMRAQVLRMADGGTVSAEQMLERFLFPRPRQQTIIEKLSGGERKRLYLLRVLMSEPNVLLLDEPTNDLDTETLTVLEDYLLQFNGTIIAVSHDRYFLDRIAERLLVFEPGGVLRLTEESCSEYLAARADRERGADTPAPCGGEKRRGGKKKKLSYLEQREWEAIEPQIAGLEDELSVLKQQIAAAGSNAAAVQELFVQQQEKEKALEAAMERWEKLSVKVEEIEKGL
ncbi:MAG: ABC-F family ATP-binding cassette domain-containing protein [Sporolactobacillus sp.]